MSSSDQSTGPQLPVLFGIFGDSGVLPRYEEIPAADVPEPYHTLLVHEHHMTVTVEAHHGCRVGLRILDQCRQGNSYARKIMLIRENDPGAPGVQFGIMRFHFDYCSDAVRDEILRGQTPLGRILIEHNVLRRIEPTAFLRVIPNAALMQYFEIDKPSPTYGRLAIIHCDDKPAVELLEIVAPETEQGVRA